MVLCSLYFFKIYIHFVIAVVILVVLSVYIFYIYYIRLIYFFTKKKYYVYFLEKKGQNKHIYTTTTTLNNTHLSRKYKSPLSFLCLSLSLYQSIISLKSYLIEAIRFLLPFTYFIVPYRILYFVVVGVVVVGFFSPYFLNFSTIFVITCSFKN